MQKVFTVILKCTQNLQERKNKIQTSWKIMKKGLRVILKWKQIKILFVVEKDKYLSLFDSQTSGQIHSQEWAKKDTRDFHNSLKFKIYKCNICHEAWPLSAKCKQESTHACSRCVRDKNATKKFSVDNNMIPSQVPK